MYVIYSESFGYRGGLDGLKDRKFPYIVIERRAVEKEYEAEFANARETFKQIESPEAEPFGRVTVSDRGKDNPVSPRKTTVWLKKIPWENGSRVLCLSERREQKEKSMDALKKKAI